MIYSEPEKITIIEGPPPEFMLAQDVWSMSMWEGARPRSVGVCQMRTFNAGTLIARCRRAWGEGRPVQLDFPQMDGLRQKAEVLAAKPGRVEEGDLLYLWVAAPDAVIEQPETPDGRESDETDDNDSSAFA